ncbi:MAG TPA: type II toxin-antitoxin system prevent-host-death family antitoxin [Geminicoccaceae bacterium]|nr:type II toxin-antitoxin system prevent-host-death family antitoxin [Geminicoccaceae bacterium]
MQEAKAKFSQLVQKALNEGPQRVSRHGEDVVVVLSVREYDKLKRARPSLKDVLMSGPDGELDLPERTYQDREIDW